MIFPFPISLHLGIFFQFDTSTVFISFPSKSVPYSNDQNVYKAWMKPRHLIGPMDFEFLEEISNWLQTPNHDIFENTAMLCFIKRLWNLEPKTPLLMQLKILKYHEKVHPPPFSLHVKQNILMLLF